MSDEKTPRPLAEAAFEESPLTLALAGVEPGPERVLNDMMRAYSAWLPVGYGFGPGPREIFSDLMGVGVLPLRRAWETSEFLLLCKGSKLPYLEELAASDAWAKPGASGPFSHLSMEYETAALCSFSPQVGKAPGQVMG